MLGRKLWPRSLLIPVCSSSGLVPEKVLIPVTAQHGTECSPRWDQFWKHTQASNKPTRTSLTGHCFVRRLTLTECYSLLPTGNGKCPGERGSQRPGLPQRSHQPGVRGWPSPRLRPVLRVGARWTPKAGQVSSTCHRPSSPYLPRKGEAAPPAPPGYRCSPFLDSPPPSDFDNHLNLVSSGYVQEGGEGQGLGRP